MEEGFIADSTYGATVVPRWVAGPPEQSFWRGTKTDGKDKHSVVTYRCPRCGYLESYAREIAS